MSRIASLLLFCTAAFFFLSKSSSADPVTVLAIKDALTSAIAEFRQALNEATYDAKSVGNSLQANAQNVLKDIDRVLSSKLKYTLDRLEAQELRLAEDAERLAALLRQASDQLLARNFDRARELIADGDILAYNTSYSLPCRSARPRVLISRPLSLKYDEEVHTVEARGNFLLQGGNLSVRVNGVPAEISGRTDSAISFTVPDAVLAKARDRAITATAEIAGLMSIERDYSFFWGCVEKSKAHSAKPRIGFTIEPPVTYRVRTTLVTTHEVSSEQPDLEGRFERTGSGRCDDSFSADENYCLVGDGRFSRIELTEQSANCSSSIGPVNPSGDRCVLVKAHVQGCGADRGPFNTWLGCRGRGWAKYNYKLWRNVSSRQEAGRATPERIGIPGETTFSFAFPAAATEPEHQYEAIVEKLRGSRVLERRTLTNANPNNGTWGSRVAEGVLSIEVE